MHMPKVAIVQHMYTRSVTALLASTLPRPSCLSCLPCRSLPLLGSAATKAIEKLHADTCVRPQHL